MNFKAAVVQVTSTARVSNNLTKCRQFVEEACKAGAKVVGLPENFSFMGSEAEKQNLLGQIERETFLFLKETASELGIYLLGGGFPTKAPSGKVYNTAVIIGPNGEEVFRYHKAHLFDAVVGDGFSYKESNHTESGEKIPEVVQTEFGKLSSAICYDLRFPELFRALSKQGVDLCFLPAAFTVPTGEAHWHVLLRARAIENLMYVLAPGQTGTHDPHGKRKTFGHSLIISPWGEILAELNHEEGFAIATIEMEKLSEIRNTLPSLEHRRF
ncbi:carbon-nitrogen hydrolase family protein [Leptospira jelokensis]|uniref:Carbon-nitrogen hydrolase family protein n=1 Tax=Leptospira jelokensis TaxID=2484931 RepID=A0A4Z0ZX84_9LEPT|nr:carbon-nitrogen hydrolase family protein [Leptospira jelokensis]TGL62618.1 carbon-nitrogen hydrolase family protein [Leptospira jelokensis]